MIGINSHETPLISVVIPVWNVKEYLQECIDSVVMQTYSNLEIILVDDGSTDGSGEFCEVLASKDSRIRIIHQPNRGPGSARNTGIASASGRFITCIDSDDVVDARLIETLWRMAETRANAVASCSLCRFEQGEQPGYTLSDADWQHLNPQQAIRQIMYQQPQLETCVMAKLYPKALLERHRIRFPDTCYEDLATVYRIIAVSSGVVHTSGAGYGYRQRASGIMLGGFTSKKGQDILTVCKGLTDFFAHASAAEKRMAACRCFSAVSNVFMTIPKERFARDEEMLWQAMKQYRKGLPSNRDARLKNRIGAVVSYLGKGAMRALYRAAVKRSS